MRDLKSHIYQKEMFKRKSYSEKRTHGTPGMGTCYAEHSFTASKASFFEITYNRIDYSVYFSRNVQIILKEDETLMFRIILADGVYYYDGVDWHKIAKKPTLMKVRGVWYPNNKIDVYVEYCEGEGWELKLCCASLENTMINGINKIRGTTNTFTTLSVLHWKAGDWSDYFEDYDIGSNLNGQNGWVAASVTVQEGIHCDVL